MSSPKDKGWAKGGSVEAVKASALVLILLVIDVWIVFFGVMRGNAPAIEILFALVALNIVVIGLCGHWAILASIRKGYWTKVYPLEVTTVLDSIEGYLDKASVQFKQAEEEHVYTEDYLDVLRCTKPRFVIKLRSVTFLGNGVAVLVGPEDRKNSDVVRRLLYELDDIVEQDLKEGIQRGKEMERKTEEE